MQTDLGIYSKTLRVTIEFVDYNKYSMYRSRLQRVEEKKNVKKAVWLIVITVAVLVAAVVWGLPLLVRLAVTIGDFNASRAPVEKTDTIPPAPPQLVTSYEATNSATQVVSGWTEPGSTVYLTQNSKSAGNIVSKEDGSFQFNDITLADGKNDFVAIAVDQSGNKSSPSSTASTVFSNKKPKLEISNPSDKQVISGSNPRIEVKGQTDQGNRITVNDRIIIVSGDGKFTTELNLNSGDNTISISTTDQMGNRNDKELTVTYSP